MTFQNLTNPCWFSLQETHRHFAVGKDICKRYQPHIVSFAALHPEHKNATQELNTIIEPGESFFLIGEFGALPENYSVEIVLPCAQMICTKEIQMKITEAIEPLSEKDDDEILALIDVTLPGYYLRGTRLMGDYSGIRVNGKLVAMTGERMKMDGLTEISAVVTHPDFAGRGYAQQLVAYTSNKNFAAGITPYLHTGASNKRAIKIYELLGYKTERIIDFTRIKRIK